MYKIEKENLEALFRKIAESQDLILPIKKAGQTNFGLWNEGERAADAIARQYGIPGESIARHR